MLLCVVIYLAPRYNKDLLSDFSEFLAELHPKYDRVFIYICCPEEPISSSILNFIDSFNFVLSVSGPTHELRHTLDLVLLHVLGVSNLDFHSICGKHWT